MFRAQGQKYEFGGFQLDTAEGVLRQAGKILPLTPKALQALELLLRNSGRVVSRAEMLESLWPDTHVEESNLTVTISILRKALGDSENGTTFVETVPKRGYRFVLPVKTSSNDRHGPDHFASMQVLRLTHDGRIMDVAISPDARLLAFVPIESGKQSLWIWDLKSDEKRQLIPSDPALIWGLRFTHDGASLLYVCTPPHSTISILHRISVSGGQSEKLVVNADSPATLSPGGDQIAFVRSFPGQHRDVLVVANTDGSAEREISSRQHPDKFSFSSPSWSRDGKLIAVGASRNNALEFAVLGISPAGALPVELSQWDWKDMRAVEWSEDGSGLYFSATASNSNSLQIWRYSWRDNVKRRITNDPNNYEEVSVAEKAEALVTMQTDAVAAIWTMPAGGVPRRITARRTEGFEGLAVVADRRIVYALTENQQTNLFSMNADGSDCRRLTLATGFFPAASRDGRHVVYVSAQGGTLHIWRMDSYGTNHKQLTNGDGESFPSISPDGQWVVYTPLGDGRNTLRKISIDGGAPMQLTSDSLAIKPVISPDGNMIACVYRRTEADKWSIAVLPASGGEPLMAFTLPYPYNQVIRWSADSKLLFFLDRQSGVYNIWKQPLDGAAPTQVTSFTEDAVFYYDWLGDEGNLVVSRGTKTRDIVLIRNFA